MLNRDYLKREIDVLPESIILKLQEFLAFQKFNLGLFESDTDYLNAIPGMADNIISGMNTPISECFETLE